MATYNSAGSGNFNADATWTESGQPSTDDVAVIASGHTVTMTADDAVGSIDIQGTLTTDGTARTLTLDDGGQGYICEHRGTVSTTIDLVINSNYAGDRLIRLNNGGNGNFRNVTVTLQSAARKLTIGTEAAIIEGNLEVVTGVFDTANFNLTCVLCHGNGTVKTGSGTYTATNDWRPDNTQLQTDGGTFTGMDHFGGAFDCNDKTATIACKRFHSGIAMSNGDKIKPRDGSDSGANLNEGGTLSAGDTTLTVQANSIDDNDYIRINTEVMKVTAGGGTTTLTVQRGQMHTNATTHADGSDIYDLGSSRTVTIEEKIVVTATAAESNASVYGPLQGKINLVTNSSGNKDFEMKEDLEVNGRVIVTGSGEFRTYTSSNTYDLLIDGATATNNQNGNDGSGYSCLAIEDSAKFLSGSSSVILDAALSSNLCDIGEFNGTDGQAVTGWTAYGTNTILYDGNTAKITRTSDASGGSSTGAYFMLNSTALSVSALTVGKVYKATFDAKVNTGSVNLKWTTQSSSLPFGNDSETHAYISGATTRNENLTNTSYEKRVAYFVAGYTSVYLYTSNMAEGQIIHIDNMTVQQVYANGNSGFIAPSSHTIAEDHKQSYGLDVASTSTVCDLGTGFYYSCGTRFGGQNHTKASGRYCTGSGDSTEYFTGGGNTLDFNSTDIILLGNSGATNTIGFNIGVTTWNCRSFSFYMPSASDYLVYWLHNLAPTVNSSTSSTAARIHTINGDVHILKGKLYNSYTDATRTGVGLVYGDTVIYDDGELNLNVTDNTSDHVDCSFNSIILKTGGALMATPKTITITDQAGSGYGFQNLTTVAKSPKNGGTFKFTDNGHVYCQESNFYNLEVALDTSSLEFRWHDSSGSIVTIDNNFIMTSGRFKFSTAGDAITVHGNTSMTSSAQYGIGSPSGVHTFNGAVRLDGGTWYMSSGTNNYNGGIRNIGATLS